MSNIGSIVVTGAAGALGTATARRLTKDGWRVALVSLERDFERLKELASEIGNAAAFGIDVGNVEAWRGALPSIDEEVGAPAGAALIAGTWQGGTPFDSEKDDGVWKAMMETNLATAQASLRALLPGMVARKKGSLVVIGSRAVERPWTSASASAYGVSKTAVVALAQTVAAEVVNDHVRVNAILPSTLDTPANRRAMPNADPSQWVSLDSAAAVIAFLLSDDARDVSGAAIPVYGRA